MSEFISAAGIFHSPLMAEGAVQELQRGALDIGKLSIVGAEHRGEERGIGYYSTGGGIKYWGRSGPSWSGLWGMMLGAGYFWIPGVGALIVAGPLVSMIVDGVEDAEEIGGLSAVGAGLYGMGISPHSIAKYETAVKNGKFLLVFNGTSEEVEAARQVLVRAKTLDTALYARESATIT